MHCCKLFNSFWNKSRKRFRRNAIIDVRKLDQRLSYLKTYFKTSLNRVAFKRRTNHKNKLSGQRPQRYWKFIPSNAGNIRPPNPHSPRLNSNVPGSKKRQPKKLQSLRNNPLRIQHRLPSKNNEDEWQQGGHWRSLETNDKDYDILRMPRGHKYRLRFRSFVFWIWKSVLWILVEWGILRGFICLIQKSWDNGQIDGHEI